MHTALAVPIAIAAAVVRLLFGAPMHLLQGFILWCWRREIEPQRIDTRDVLAVLQGRRP